MHRVAPAGLVRPPYYRRACKIKPKAKVESWLRDEFMTPADKDGSGARLYDYYKMGELAKQMPIRERIQFVSPYERPWSKMELKWHRRWHQDTFSTRKAWKLEPIPRYFDTLNFYKYITKTRIVDGGEAEAEFDQYYKACSPSTSLIDRFEEQVQETLRCYAMHANGSEDKDGISEFLRNVIDDAVTCLAENDPELASTRRIAHASRCESFWIRAGFLRMYEKQAIYAEDVVESRKRFTCDDRRRLGELAFTMRDDLALQIRSRDPLKNLFDFSDVDRLQCPLFKEDVDFREIALSPKVFNLWPDEGVLYQAPGYDADIDEPLKYGRLAVKNVVDLSKFIQQWGPQSAFEAQEMRSDNYKSIAVSSLFNWLNGQAHAIGHTQYTDIEQPITSQIIVSTGTEFFFAIGQLNTIAINIDVNGFDNQNTNVCCVEGPFKLYHEYDKSTACFKHKDNDGLLKGGLNRKLLQRIIQMVSA